MGLGPASVRWWDSICNLPSGGAHFVLRSKPSAGLEPWHADIEERLQVPKPGFLGFSVDMRIPEWIKALKSDPRELIGDCYLHTDRALDERIPTEEQPVVEGSLPYELLGARYFGERGLPMREPVILV